MTTDAILLEGDNIIILFLNPNGTLFDRKDVLFSLLSLAWDVWDVFWEGTRTREGAEEIKEFFGGIHISATGCLWIRILCLVLREEYGIFIRWRGETI